ENGLFVVNLRAGASFPSRHLSPSGWVLSSQFSASGRWLASVSKGVAAMHDTSTPEWSQVFRLQLPGRLIGDVSFSDDERWLACVANSSSSGGVRLWSFPAILEFYRKTPTELMKETHERLGERDRRDVARLATDSAN